MTGSYWRTGLPAASEAKRDRQHAGGRFLRHRQREQLCGQGLAGRCCCESCLAGLSSCTCVLPIASRERRGRGTPIARLAACKYHHDDMGLSPPALEGYGPCPPPRPAVQQLDMAPQSAPRLPGAHGVEAGAAADPAGGCRAGHHWQARRAPPRAQAAAPGARAQAASELTAALLEACSRATNAASPGEGPRLAAEVEDLAAQLATVNPTPDPASSPLISGRCAGAFCIGLQC